MWVIFVLLIIVLALIVLKLARPNQAKINALEIGFSYVQLIAVFASFPIDWPETTTSMFDAISLANLNIEFFSPECSIKLSYWLKWGVRLLVPVLVAVVFCLIYLLIRFSSRARRLYLRVVVGQSSRVIIGHLPGPNDGLEVGDEVIGNSGAELAYDEEDDLLCRFIYGYVFVISLSYTFLASTASQPFNCIAQPNGTSVLRHASSVTCYDDEWNRNIYLSVLAIIIYTLGIPATFVTVLYVNSRRGVLETPAFLRRFGFLTIPYRQNLYFWELINMSRKCLIVIIVDFLHGQNLKFVQVNVALATLFVYLAMQAFMSPYGFNWCNRLAFGWLSASLFTLFSAVLFNRGVVDTDGTILNGLTKVEEESYAILLIVILVFCGACTIFVTYLEVKRRLIRRAQEAQGISVEARQRHQKQILKNLFPETWDHLWRKLRAMGPVQREEFFIKCEKMAGVQVDGSQVMLGLSGDGQLATVSDALAIMKTIPEEPDGEREPSKRAPGDIELQTMLNHSESMDPEVLPQSPSHRQSPSLGEPFTPVLVTTSPSARKASTAPIDFAAASAALAKHAHRASMSSPTAGSLAPEDPSSPVVSPPPLLSDRASVAPRPSDSVSPRPSYSVSPRPSDSEQPAAVVEPAADFKELKVRVNEETPRTEGAPEGDDSMPIASPSSTNHSAFNFGAPSSSVVQSSKYQTLSSPVSVSIFVPGYETSGFLEEPAEQTISSTSISID